MKKIVYLCVMMLISLDMTAQIDPYDRNWDTIFIEDFSGNRSWSNLWEDQDANSPSHVPIWKCFVDALWSDGVTNYNHTTKKYSGFHAYLEQTIR